MRRILAMTTTCVCLMAVAAGCNHDGRYLRPPRPDQNATISTTAAPTTAGAGFDDGPGDGALGSLTPSTVAIGVPTATASSTPGGAGGIDPASATAAPLTVNASWRSGAPIDARYTCDGDNVSPPLSWSPAPAGTVEIALTLTDDQKPGFVHWAVAGLDPSVTQLAEGAVPEGAIQSLNGAGTIGYTGPCPPQGETHTYRLTVDYLDAQTELGDGAAGADLVLAIQSTTAASAVITGTYVRAA